MDHWFDVDFGMEMYCIRHYLMVITFPHHSGKFKIFSTSKFIRRNCLQRVPMFPMIIKYISKLVFCVNFHFHFHFENMNFFHITDVSVSLSLLCVWLVYIFEFLFVYYIFLNSRNQVRSSFCYGR